MLVFRTQLPLKDSITGSHCLDLFLKWISENPHYSICQIPYDPASGCNFDFRKKHMGITIRHYQDGQIQISACRFQNRAGNVLWQSDCIFYSSSEERWVLIEQRRISSHPDDHPYRVRKPHIVRMLVENGFCREDNGIPITDLPLDADGPYSCDRIFSENSRSGLPCALISCDKEGNHSVNCQYFAAQLGGMAHTFVQNHPKAPDLPPVMIAGEAVTDGKIGISLIGQELCYSPSDYADDRVLTWQIINRIRTGLTESAPLYDWDQVLALTSDPKDGVPPAPTAVS